MAMSEQATAKQGWFWYLLFMAAACCFFLYALFPAKAVEGFLSRNLQRRNPELQFAAAGIKPWLPPGLLFTNCVISRQPENLPLFKAEKLLAGLEIVALLKKDVVVAFKGEAYRGFFSGRLDPDEQQPGQAATEVLLKDIQLGDVAGLDSLLGRRLEGALAGTISYSGAPATPSAGEGAANLRLEGGRLEMPAMLFGLKSIDLQELILELGFKNGVLKLEHVEMKGHEMEGTLSGTVTVKSNIRQSSLNLKGSIEPFPEFFDGNPEAQEAMKLIKQRANKGKFSFIIRGTVQEPEFRFL